MKNKKVWIAVLIIVVLVGAGYVFQDTIMGSFGQQSSAQTRGANQARAANPDAAETRTVAVRPAADIAQVSAAGNIALANQQPAVLYVEGIVAEIAVEVGDQVEAGDLLLSLDTGDLERAVTRAELDLAVRQAQLDSLMEPTDPADIAAARANLVSAQEDLSAAKAGAGEAELAAARATLSAAQQRYQELLEGKSEAELTQLGVDLHKAGITLQQAQEAYNEIAFRDDVGRTQQAMDLQEATIDYDAARAAYEVATEPASQADLQDALSAIRDAELQLDGLINLPSQTDIAAAEAQVAGAESELAQLLKGPTEAELREAELNLEQAHVDLDEKQSQLALSKVRAPIAGTILAVDVELGQQATPGLSAMNLADVSQLELTVNVAEVDVSKVEIGQPANISIDALPDRTVSGVVSRIAPSSESDGGVVNYPVTIRLDDLNLEDVKSGMTAVAALTDETTEPGWLVPTNSLVEFEGETTLVVIRNGQRDRIAVIPGSSQGEWTVVQSAELKAGDEVVGEVASFLNEEGGRRGFFGRPPR